MRQTLEQAFDYWGDGIGIFAGLESYQVPWNTLNIADVLDDMYFGNISGEKLISPMVRKLKSGDTLTTQEVGKLAKIAYNMYRTKWTKEWDIMSLQYDPIENYSMIEQMTNDITTTDYGHVRTHEDDLSHSKTGTETHGLDITNETEYDTSRGKTGTETYEKGTTDTKTLNLTDTTTTTTYGFNSSSPVNSGGENVTHTGTDTLVRSGEDETTYNTTETHDGTDTTTQTGSDTLTYNTTDTNEGTATDTESGRDTHTRNYRLSRSGNIGVTTSQQMIQSERDLWKWDYFYDIVFPDIDKVLTLGVY